MKKFLLFLISAFAVNFYADAQISSNQGVDSLECISNISLFNKYLGQENYLKAVAPWRSAFKNCPASEKQIYTAGVTIFEKKIREEKNSALKSKFLDTLMLIYDQRIKYFGEEGIVTGGKALSLYEFDPGKKEEINSLLKKSIDLTGKNSNPVVLTEYFRVNSELFVLKKKSINHVVDVYFNVNDLIEANLNGSNASDYNKSRLIIDSLFNKSISCNDLVSMFTPLLKSAPDDIPLLKKIVKLFGIRNCDDADIYRESAEKLHNIEPTSAIAINLAHISIAKGQSAKAINYFNEAIDLASDNITKASIYIEQSAFNLNTLKNFAQAKTYAQRASLLRPDWAVPFVMLGDIYSAGSSICNDEFKGATALWVSTDLYVKAKNTDASISEQMNKKISQNEKHYPGKEELLAKGMKAGDSWTVKCWVNEKTTVRVK